MKTDRCNSCHAQKMEKKKIAIANQNNELYFQKWQALLVKSAI